jgi:AcrR family transcriptional regulator
MSVTGQLKSHMARTQQQRSEETIARLLDASIDTIIEFGYARTSAALIAKRAQVSDGALFRHFPTMRDLMTATLREAGRRQLELYASRIAQIPMDTQAAEAVLPILRDITCNPTNGVIYELAVAARTDDKLRATLKDELEIFDKKIFDAAKATPSAEELKAFGEENFEALVTVLINTFDGAAIFQYLRRQSQSQVEERRIPMLMSLLNAARPTG